MGFSERDFNKDGLLMLMPRVLRAREFRLYLEGGKRLVDLWLHGGRAVLGHKPPMVLRELKNAAERGLFTPFPHPCERRLLKALEGFFPNRAFRLYLDSGSLRRALEGAGFTEGVPVWRPFLETNEEKPQGAETPVLLPVLPWPLGPEVLVLDKSLEASFPAGGLIPPVLIAPAARALYNLAAAVKASNWGRMRYIKIEKALSGSRWSRHGIYLMLNSGMDGTQYKALFLRFLDGGFLIPPSPAEPAILPASMSKGEEVKLAELLKG